MLVHGSEGLATRILPLLDQLPDDEAVLIPLYEAYRAISEALTGEINKPRVNQTAAEMIETESERADDYACAIAEKLSRLTEVKRFWLPLYIETMLSHVFFIGDDENLALSVLAAAMALPIVDESCSRAPS